MKPAVLLVEDDASIRRFVAMALEELPVDLAEAASLAEAEAALAGTRPVLLLCDLMLPDGSGISLLQALAADPVRRGGMRLVAFSAGISAARREQLLELGVDEVLAKPVSLDALEACVQRALAQPVQSAAAPAGEDPVARFFGGNRVLYDTYRASCLLQFPRDIAEGDAALAARHFDVMRRLAHSLKSVLLTLGHDEASRQAAALEAMAATADGARVPEAWAALRAHLAAVR